MSNDNKLKFKVTDWFYIAERNPISSISPVIVTLRFYVESF